MKKKFLFIALSLFVGFGGGVVAQESVNKVYPNYPKITGLIGGGIAPFGQYREALVSILGTAYYAGIYADCHLKDRTKLEYSDGHEYESNNLYTVMVGPVGTIVLNAEHTLKIFPMMGFELQKEGFGIFEEFRYGLSFIYCYKYMAFGWSGKIDGCALSVGVAF
jgi:hypothetical protein